MAESFINTTKLNFLNDNVVILNFLQISYYIQYTFPG